MPEAARVTVDNAHACAPVRGLVSAIVIFYNAGRFLEQAIASVLHQRYERWELILVDDGSSDTSSMIALRVADAFPDRVRYVEHAGHANCGMSASRNLGLRHARGEYVAFLDADDVWPVEKLERQVGALEAYPEAGLACGAVRLWYSWAPDASDRPNDLTWRPIVEPDAVVEPPALLVALLLEEGPVTTASVVRRALLERVGGFEEAFAGMYEDQAMLVKLALVAPAFVSSECWYLWRRHDASCCSMSIAGQDYARARRRFLRWAGAYLDGYPEHAATVRPVLEAELRRLAWRERRALAAVSGTARVLGGTALAIARRVVPRPVRRRLRRALRKASSHADRAVPVDRFYVDRFLASRRRDIRGRVLEIGGHGHVRGTGRPVTELDVPGVSRSPAGVYDCVICVHALTAGDDLRAGLVDLHRVLAPGGTLLITLAGCNGTPPGTTSSLRRLLEEAFPPSAVTVKSCGTRASALALSQGRCAETLSDDELDSRDGHVQVVVLGRAVKRAPANGGRRA
jgi:glycosyltransferase involved in cell wall biosynthesis